MKVKELADSLRQRLLKRTFVSEDVLKETPDKVIIESYMKCSICNELMISYENMESYVVEFENVDDFFDYVDSVTKAHLIKTQGQRSGRL